MKARWAIAMAFLLAACQSAEYACPTPERVRRGYSVGYRMKMHQRQMQARAEERNQQMAQHKQLQKVTKQEVKKLNVDEWDCPKPGTLHTTQLRKQRKQLEKRHSETLKKNAEQMEGSTPLPEPSGN